jgi:DNA topoisomerase-1
MYKRLGNYKSGFSFVYASNNKPIHDKKLLEWFKDLHIPPAYQNVVIYSKSDDSKVLAYGFDSKDRKQYLYNPKFVEERQKNNYKKIISLHDVFEKIMHHISHDMLSDDTKKKEIAMIIYLIIYCGFRIGNKVYEKQNNSYGISTIKFKHIKFVDDNVMIDFIGKKGVYNQASCNNKHIYAYLKQKKQLNKDDDNVFTSISSKDVNEYLKQFHESISCKDLRTWCANLMFIEYIKQEIINKSKRPVKNALEKVSNQLHNTANVCKKSYIDPNIILLIEEKIKNDDIK